jgi:hypothetical protein
MGAPLPSWLEKQQKRQKQATPSAPFGGSNLANYIEDCSQNERNVTPRFPPHCAWNAAGRCKCRRRVDSLPVRFAMGLGIPGMPFWALVLPWKVKLVRSSVRHKRMSRTGLTRESSWTLVPRNIKMHGTGSSVRQGRSTWGVLPSGYYPGYFPGRIP